MSLVALVTVILLCNDVFAAIPLGIPLTVRQLKQIERNKVVIADIKQNYFRNRRYYSSLPPIIELNKDQKEEILATYGHFFAESKPEILSSYVFNGTEITKSSDTEDFATSGVEVCPTTSTYEDIQFTVNAENQVLQMVQMENLGQWILEETCDSASGNAAGTICVSRERLINAVVINMETSETTYEQIKVYCCSAQLA